MAKQTSARRFKWQKYEWGAVIPFVLLHAACVTVFWIPFRRKLLVWLVAAYLVRMFGITAGYHRYFSHRSYKMGRVAQFCMAFLAQTSAQKGVLWWAAHHREHHFYSDEAEDIHSPLQRGFWWAHVGWILSNQHDGYDPRLIQDFGKFPELRWLNRHHWVPTAVLGAALFLIGGWSVFVWGYVVSTVLLFHCTFAINSLAHLWGWRRFDTPDGSRNNPLLALITLGEGWHNNHHQYMYSCRQGLCWWEVDLTFYVLKLLSWLRITRDLRGVRRERRPWAAPALSGTGERKAAL